MDTMHFIDYCLSIVSEFLKCTFVFYDFNHVFYEVCCIASHKCFYVFITIHALSEMTK